MRLHRAVWTRRTASFRRWRAVLTLAALGAALAAATVAPAAPAAVHATAAAAEQDGYGRITLAFDALPHFAVERRNDILIARFDPPVAVDIGPVAAGLPDFVALGRRDPDHYALRFSLSQEVSVHTLQGGDTLFIDLLPRAWVGMPPGLPSATLADMNRRLQQQRATAQAERERATAALKPMALRVGTTAGTIRLVFTLGGRLDARFARDGDAARVSVSAPVPFDLAAARAALPSTISGLGAAVEGNRRVVHFTVPAGWRSESYREEGNLVVTLRAGPKPSRRIGNTLSVTPRPAVDELSPPLPPNASPRDPPTTGSIAPAAAPPAPAAAPPHGLTPDVRRTDDGALLTFPFPIAPAAAAFQRGRYLWLVFDSPTAIDASGLVAATGGLVSDIRTVAADPGRALLLHIAASHHASLAFADGRWALSIGAQASSPASAIGLVPGLADDGRAMISARLGAAGGLHWLTDPAAGDRLAVITLPPPVRRLERPRAFVDFDALATLQGLALRTDADDLTVGLAGGVMTVTRRAGLTLSPGTAPAGGTVAATMLDQTGIFDRSNWRELREKPLYAGVQALLHRAATASAAERPAALLALARFQFAHDNATDTLAALTLARAAKPQLTHDADVVLLEGAAQVELRRFAEARLTLAAPPLATAAEAALWRGIAEARLGEIAAAHRSFRDGRPVLHDMPDPLQLRFRLAETEVAIAMRDYAAAAAALAAADAIADGGQPFRRDVLRGRIAEGEGQPGTALDAYRAALGGSDRIAAADAMLRATRLRYGRKDIDLAAATDALEGLAVTWRGDMIEARTLGFLSHLYGAAKRWRAAFTTLKTAVAIFPDAPSTRAAQDEMAVDFADLFLDDGADAAPETLKSLALFYDFREMIPTGRKGDEMIRRLADRLVKVDLLDQAGALLDYQVAHRLSGVARATVAARAAFVHLLDHQPHKAETVLQQTRIAGLPADIEESRLTMEARATADLGRPDLALELIGGLDGPAVRHLRADILWETRRWQPAAEALELVAGDTWKGHAPLDAATQTDVLRAAVAYALAGDPLGLDRLRGKFAAKMATGPDGTAFDAVTAPVPKPSQALQDVAHAVSRADSLAAFIAAYRAQHPNAAVPTPEDAAAG
jgi:hypothetical protein